MTNSALYLDKISVTKGHKEILRQVTASIPRGKLTALVGANGAGKSTLLRVTLGLEPSTGGTSRLGGPNGANISAMTLIERARRLAWVPDHSDMPFDFSVLDAGVMGRFPWHQGTPRRDDIEAARHALARVGIENLAERSLASLSSGERQKAMIARALAGEAPNILLDEPCANLDVGAALHTLALLKELTGEGKTVCLSLHDLSLAHRFADHMICLLDGSVTAEGSPSEVLTSVRIKEAFGVRSALAKTPDGRQVLVFD